MELALATEDAGNRSFLEGDGLFYEALQTAVAGDLDSPGCCCTVFTQICEWAAPNQMKTTFFALTKYNITSSFNEWLIGRKPCTSMHIHI